MLQHALMAIAPILGEIFKASITRLSTVEGIYRRFKPMETYVINFRATIDLLVHPPFY